ncbi:MAG: Lrp/AsnC family transcriptional regulator [Candidatus ainarchaeum sp.]|nr:Lrp/AsnC family transcriptional regulator [Candidatus ainarchaeum sp.]
MEKLDATDRELLKLLQKGDMCKPGSTKLAHRLKAPITTVHSKLKRLEKLGVIKGYPAAVDGKKVGAGLTIFTVLKVNYAVRYKSGESIRKFGEELSRIPEVLELHSCSGDWDYLIKLKVKDSDDYARIGSEMILPLGGIERMESYIAYITHKESSAVPL